MSQYTRKQRDAVERAALAVTYQDRREAISRWQQRVREDMNGRPMEAVLLAEMARMLSPLIEYLARGKDANAQAIRVWCLLYAVRPELIDYATFQDAADRYGCTQENVIYHFARLKKLFPAFALPERRTGGDKLRQRLEKMKAGSLAAHYQRKRRAFMLRKEGLAA